MPQTPILLEAYAPQGNVQDILRWLPSEAMNVLLEYLCCMRLLYWSISIQILSDIVSEFKLINAFVSSNNNNLIDKCISALSKSNSLLQQMYLGTDAAISDQDKAKLFNNYFYVLGF